MFLLHRVQPQKHRVPKPPRVLPSRAALHCPPLSPSVQHPLPVWGNAAAVAGLQGEGLGNPPPLLTFDSNLCNVLTEDHFDAESDEEHTAKGELLTPFEGTEDNTWYYTPKPDQEPTFWDNVLPRYISPTPPPQQQQQQQPSWWETDPGGWTPLNQIPRDWGGTMKQAGSMGAPSYKGGNVMPSGEAGQ